VIAKNDLFIKICVIDTCVLIFKGKVSTLVGFTCKLLMKEGSELALNVTHQSIRKFPVLTYIYKAYRQCTKGLLTFIC